MKAPNTCCSAPYIVGHRAVGVLTPELLLNLKTKAVQGESNTEDDVL